MESNSSNTNRYAIANIEAGSLLIIDTATDYDRWFIYEKPGPVGSASCTNAAWMSQYDQLLLYMDTTPTKESLKKAYPELLI